MMMFHGDVSEALEQRVAELAERYDMRLVTERIAYTKFHFATDGEPVRTADGDLALYVAIRADAALYQELKQKTDLFDDEEIEF